MIRWLKSWPYPVQESPVTVEKYPVHPASVSLSASDAISSSEELEAFLENLSADQIRSFNKFRILAAEAQAIIYRLKMNTREQNYTDLLNFRTLMNQIDGLILDNKFIQFDLEEKIKLSLCDDELLWHYQPLFTKEDANNTLIAIVDTETTGLAAHDQPVSIGVVLLEVTTVKGDVVIPPLLTTRQSRGLMIAV